MFTDGNVSNDTYGERAPKIRIELCERDYDIIQRFLDSVNSDSTIRYSKRAGRNGTYSAGFRSHKMSSDLANYGIIQNKTEQTIHIPENIPYEYMRHFVRGLIDGDGSLFYSNGYPHISFCAHYISIVEDFERICRKLISKQKTLKPIEWNGVYHVTFNGNDAIALAYVCYKDSTISIARKHRLAMMMIEDKRVDDIVCPTLKDVG